MARSLDQVSNDLSALEASTARIDEDLQVLYKEYLAVLGNAVKRQLVLAVYHLCTQAYPDEFLNLSVKQREKLQADVRKTAAQGQTQIEQLGQAMDVSGLASKLEEVIAPDLGNQDDATVEIADAVEEIAKESHGYSNASSDSIDTTNTPTVEEADAPSSLPTTAQTDAELAAPKEAAEMIRQLSTSLSLFSVLGAEPRSPVSLAKRHVLLERNLRVVLQTLSSLTNHLLKQVNILPDLPEMVIAAAAEAEPNESASSTPNVLNVLVEIGGDRRDNDEQENDNNNAEDLDGDIFNENNSDREMTHLVAINLRLADIEFSDTHTAVWRGKLQETLLKLKRLGSRYQKLQREKARAEAEHAWRAVWFES